MIYIYIKFTQIKNNLPGTNYLVNNQCFIKTVDQLQRGLNFELLIVTIINRFELQIGTINNFKYSHIY